MRKTVLAENTPSAQAVLSFGGEPFVGFSMMAGVTVLTGVRKRYTRSGPWVLGGIDLTVSPGSVTAIVAGNGVGKSTLLRIVAGAALPTSGTVTGRPRRVGYIPERAATALRMTARQYLMHIARMQGVSTQYAKARTDELAARLGLAPGPDVPISALSKGNGQKVAVMQAFLSPPELLVVDEPATGLDGPARAELAKLMSEAENDGAAVVLSVHESSGLPGGTLYRLTDGKLVADAGEGMRIVLRAARSGLSITRFEGIAEVLSQERGQVTLRTDDADKLLMQALADGWSLVEAKP